MVRFGVGEVFVFFDENVAHLIDSVAHSHKHSRHRLTQVHFPMTNAQDVDLIWKDDLLGRRPDADALMMYISASSDVARR